MQPTLVIGATGHVGRHAVAALLGKGAAVRALVRTPSAAKLPADVEVVKGDLTDPASLGASLDGIGSAFLVFPTLQADDHAPAVVGALAAHATRIAYLSADGVPADPGAEPSGILGSHARVERLIRESGVDWTFLRSGGMATNTLSWAPGIRRTGTVRWPYGAAARSLVHEADLGAVAAHVLTTEGHRGTSYVLTGTEVLTQAEQAKIIGEAIGRTVRWDEMPRAEARAQMIDEWGWDADAADGALDAWASMIGNRGGVTDTVERLVGRPAHSFRRWAQDHADDFR